MPTLVTSDVGRLVRGHPMIKTQKTDPKSKQKIFKDGQPVMSYSFAVAYPKQTFYQSQMWAVMNQTAISMFPQGVPQNFAWKIRDGDGVDQFGKRYDTREGYGGHIIVNYDTQFQINAYRQNPSGAWDQITEHDFKTGDWIAVSVNVDGNKPAVGSLLTPSLYLNPQGILHIGNGPAIINAPSADQMFAGHQYQLPPGATAPGGPPQMPAGMPNAPGMAPGYPQGGPSAQQPYQPPQQGYPAPLQAGPGAPMAGYAPQGAPVNQPPAYATGPQQQAPGGGYPSQYQPGPGNGAPAYQPAPDFVQAAMGQTPQQPQYAPTPGYLGNAQYPSNYPQSGIPPQAPANLNAPYPVNQPGFPQR